MFVRLGVVPVPVAEPAAVMAFIGLGSNLDGPRVQVSSALDELLSLPRTRVVARSRLYASVPMGPPGQPDYVNAVAGLATGLSAHNLLDALQAIESAHARVRGGPRWGPRTLDLDLLVYGDALIRDARLRVPHPGIAERGFVLLPLAEIVPRLHIPGLGAAGELAAALVAPGAWPLEDAR